MDISTIDMKALAPQLRKPEGELGKQVGETMAAMTLEINAFAIQCLDVQPRDHVLEIGFGPGEAIAELVRLTPNGYIAGIDHSEEMVEMATGRNHRSVMQEHVELTLGTARDLPYEDDSFDKILAVNVFHFWPEPAQELAQCLRVLKPGGRILFYVTHPSAWPAGLKESGVFIAREPQEVERILRDAGFTDVTTKVYEYKDGKGFAVMGTK